MCYFCYFCKISTSMDLTFVSGCTTRTEARVPRIILGMPVRWGRPAGLPVPPFIVILPIIFHIRPACEAGHGRA
jgi:hypothetical protein